MSEAYINPIPNPDDTLKRLEQALWNDAQRRLFIGLAGYMEGFMERCLSLSNKATEFITAAQLAARWCIPLDYRATLTEQQQALWQQGYQQGEKLSVTLTENTADPKLKTINWHLISTIALLVYPQDARSDRRDSAALKSWLLQQGRPAFDPPPSPTGGEARERSEILALFKFYLVGAEDLALRQFAMKALLLFGNQDEAVPIDPETMHAIATQQLLWELDDAGQGFESVASVLQCDTQAHDHWLVLYRARYGEQWLDALNAHFLSQDTRCRLDRCVSEKILQIAFVGFSAGVWRDKAQLLAMCSKQAAQESAEGIPTLEIAKTFIMRGCNPTSFRHWLGPACVVCGLDALFAYMQEAWKTEGYLTTKQHILTALHQHYDKFEKTETAQNFFAWLSQQHPRSSISAVPSTPTRRVASSQLPPGLMAS